METEASRVIRLFSYSPENENASGSEPGKIKLKENERGKERGS
jgi:hypothetical protein